MTIQADYQAGLDAYQQGDYGKAYDEWIKVAVSKEGEVHPAVRAESEYALGMMYWLGQGVEQDTAAAAVWLQEAAELDHPGAQSKLGYLYLTGEGAQHNDFEALKWLQMAAYKNDADAQYNLGVMYRDGLGVDPDAGQSMYWFKQAAGNGDPISARIVNEGVFVDPAKGQPAAEVAEDPSRASVPFPQEPLALPQEPVTAAEGVAGSPVTGDPTIAETAEDQPVTETAEDPSRTIAVVPQEPMASELQQVFGENWIRERSGENFTIQIIALQKPDKLHEFAARHAELAPFAIYQSEWKGKPLYVLIQGDYTDLVQAREAAQKFPPGLQKREELWIRRFMMVQGALP